MLPTIASAAAYEMNRPEDTAGLRDVERVIAHQERGRPPHETPTPERGERLGDDGVDGGTLAQHEPHRVEERRCRAAILTRIQAAAPRLADGEQDEDPGQNSRYSEGKEHRPPPEAVSERSGNL